MISDDRLPPVDAARVGQGPVSRDRRATGVFATDDREGAPCARRTPAGRRESDRRADPGQVRPAGIPPGGWARRRRSIRSGPGLRVRAGSGVLLVLDDFLTTPITSETAAELLNILAAREGRGSTAVTSQFDPEDWYKSLHDAVIAESILNRIISNAEIVQLAGPNMRRHTAAESTEDVHTR